ncbi:MAG TPA: decaprenyl-phosphate phosphoribosyltransferase [Gelria sp.]|jgi:4-hydroxybenzoate polyprenyltransferase|nr:decaprenyl-phosphate phosphoribosyltransferase [Gelria sp.]
MNIILLFIKELRPKQWTKNLLVFAALIFTIPNITINMVYAAVAGFMLFSFVSGAVYILNDLVDLELDRQHPTKKNRPLASGDLPPAVAISGGSIILLASLVTSYYLNIWFGFILTFYFVLNVAYSFYLKNIVIIDVMVIATGFVLRAAGGAYVINVPMTPWFIICTMLLALFLAISKRRHELILVEQAESAEGDYRVVLDSYSTQLLDEMNSIVTTATIISYALFTFTSGRTLNLMWTIPLVIYGIFRYLYLIHVENKGGQPDEILLQDKPILITVLLYTVLLVVILMFF